MNAAVSPVVAAEGTRALVRDELAELIMEANRHFESDRDKAKCCIQRAAMLVRDRRIFGAQVLPVRAERGGLGAWQKKKLMSYIETNIGGRISVAELAAIIHISPGHLSRAFKRSFGVSPHAYITRQRILRAEILMATSNQALARIAIECGLSDQAHFSRTFRRLVGVSPHCWRQAVGERQDIDSAQ